MEYILNQVIGFIYKGYVYQWDHKLGMFTPNGGVPIDFPLFLSYIPDEARSIKLSVYNGGNNNGI